MPDKLPGFHRISDRPGEPPVEVWERQLGLVMDRVADLTERVDHVHRGLPDAVSAGVQQGIKALAADPEFGEAFWRRGFEHMAAHAGRAGSQWIGSRILTALVLAIMSACVAYLVKTGKI